jgi:Ser/Thr protein kinase RdoA (MazF antagonist)
MSPDEVLLGRAGEAARQFAVYGDFTGVEAHGTGHINRTFVFTMDQGGRPVRYLLQLLNTFAFREPVPLMDNIVRVTEHLRRRLAAEDALAPPRHTLSRRVLTVLPSRDGKPHHIDPEGGFWRCYLFIEGAGTTDIMDSTVKAFALAEAAGRFQYLLSDLPGARLAETIPGFHDARRRYAAFERALAGDRAGRACRVGPEIEFFKANREGFDRIVAAMESGEVPERICHNDTKISNLLLDDETGEAICVIDLDTVMPGSSAYDFGDLARTAASSTAEDDPDPRNMALLPPMYEALARGFARGTRTAGEGSPSYLTPAERELLPWGARTLTMLMGIRFLTDHLEGDVYYHIARDGHNLDRSRTQIALIRSMDAHWDSMLAATHAAFETPGAAKG